MKVNKKTRNVIGLVFAFFSIISIFTFPETHTKYIDKNENALSYNSRLYKLYNGSFPGGINPTSPSSETTAYLTFHFDRNPVVTDETIDVYEIVIPDVCSLQSISTSGSKNGNKITFQTKEQSSTSVIIRCNVDDIKTKEEGIDVLRVPTIQVKEKVGTDKNEFLYQEGNFVFPLEKYNELYKPEPPAPEAIITDTKLILPNGVTNKYNTFLSWITAYANKSGYSKEVLTYVKNKYPNETSILNMSIKLPGFSAKYDSTNKTYIYEIVENFVGYARTEPFSKTDPQFMYFSTSDKKELQSAFEYYLKSYSPDTSNYQMILDYVKHFDEEGISYVVLPNSEGKYQTINGMIYTPATNQLRILPSIFDYAYLLTGTPIRVSLGFKLEMHDAFREGILSVYKDIVSTTAKSVIETNYDIYRSIVKNGVENPNEELNPISFRDYFIVYDDEFGHYLLLDIKSLAGSKKEDEQFNYAIFDKLEISKDVQITFQNTTDTLLDIQIINQDKTEIMNAVNSLNTYFNSEIKEVDLIFETNENGDYQVKYQITKEIL